VTAGAGGCEGEITEVGEFVGVERVVTGREPVVNLQVPNG
jgi:hypothetical protein